MYDIVSLFMSNVTDPVCPRKVSSQRYPPYPKISVSISSCGYRSPRSLPPSFKASQACDLEILSCLAQKGNDVLLRSKIAQAATRWPWQGLPDLGDVLRGNQTTHDDKPESAKIKPIMTNSMHAKWLRPSLLVVNINLACNDGQSTRDCASTDVLILHTSLLHHYIIIHIIHNYIMTMLLYVIVLYSTFKLI